MQVWTNNPERSDTATTGQWEFANPQATSHRGLDMQLGNAYRGIHALVTGATAGPFVGSHDVDGGTNSIRSPLFTLPANHHYRISLAYSFAHLSNTTTADFLRITLISETGSRKVILTERGAPVSREARWQTINIDISDMAGNRAWLLIEAADGGNGSIVEAAIDDIQIEQSNVVISSNPTNNTGSGTPGESVFRADFSSATNWTADPLGEDTASRGQWNNATPQITSFRDTILQPGPISGGGKAMVTGAAAGTSVGTNDIDGGKTTIRSPLINLPAGSGYQLTLDYYFGHLWNTSSADYFAIYTVSNGQRQQIFRATGRPENQPGIWKTLNRDLSNFAGSSIYLDIEAADNGAGSVIEAAFDNLLITYQ